MESAFLCNRMPWTELMINFDVTIVFGYILGSQSTKTRGLHEGGFLP